MPAFAAFPSLTVVANFNPNINAATLVSGSLVQLPVIAWVLVGETAGITPASNPATAAAWAIELAQLGIACLPVTTGGYSADPQGRWAITSDGLQYRLRGTGPRLSEAEIKAALA
jgi:hypothetical protein